MQLVRTLLSVNGLSVTTHSPVQIRGALEKARYSAEDIETILTTLYEGKVPSPLQNLLYSSAPATEKTYLEQLATVWDKIKGGALHILKIVANKKE
jgi:hypothetical protein